MAEFGEVTLSLLKGFAQNCQIFLYTLIAALPLGLIITFGSMAKFRPVRYVARAFVWIIRGTWKRYSKRSASSLNPILVQDVYTFF